MRVAVPFLLLYLIAVAGCGTARRGEPVGAPLSLDARELRGQQGFMYFCHKCHPGGEGGLGPALNNKPLPAPLIKAQVRLGAGAMPDFPRELLPDDRLDEIVAYMKTIRKQ